MLLQEGGLPAVCQGDMDALLTTILFHRGEAHPTYIGGPHGTDNGMLDVSHCVLPRTMSGLHTPPQDYYLADYHGSGEGCTVHTSLPTGKRVTVGRLMQGLGVLLLDGGTVQGTMDREDRCRNTVYVQMDSGTALLDRLKGHQQHVVVACGDHLDTVAARARERDIRVEHLSGR
jgi:L-fucose isomerase-like protein